VNTVLAPVFWQPAQAIDHAQERFGVAPPKDFRVLTLLLKEISGGLQLRTRSGDWIEAPPIEGTLVCNNGDLLQRWSNDRFLSTVHRVINRTQNARYSISVFFDPASQTMVDPADLGVVQSDCKHAPISVGKHIASRNAKAFPHLKGKGA